MRKKKKKSISRKDGGTGAELLMILYRIVSFLHAEVSNSEQIISIYENSLFLGDK